MTLRLVTPTSVAEALTAATRRLNVGCGQFPLPTIGWTNLDADPAAPAELHASVPPLPFDDGALDDIYAGHFLEHLAVEDAHAFLIECRRCLAPGGRLGIVVPDTRAVMEAYLAGTPRWVDAGTPMSSPTPVLRDASDLDEVCRMFLYSPLQASPHQWSYDLGTLRRAIERAGLRVTGEINRWLDPRIPVGAWYQCGLDAVKD